MSVLPAAPLLVAPDGPVDDMAFTKELLSAVAAKEPPAALRLYEPPRTVAFGRRETHRAGYRAAVDAARRHGFGPVVRNAGGLAVAYGPGSLVVELLAADPSPPDGLRARFAAFAAGIAAALRAVGVDAEVGELPGEYCPGEFSVRAGTVKLAGTAQRLVAGAWLCSASVVVTGAAELRAVLAEVNEHLGFGWRPGTLGGAADLVPGLTTGAVAAALERTFGGRRA
ncbi:MAG TPA: lipoate--protein ligase family protein [Pseudonocardiaceae bacterium]